MDQIAEITSIERISKLAMEPRTDWRNYGDLCARSNGNELLILNYTAAAQYNDRWNFAERVCRGLIVNTRTGEIVARPFDKFFNWLQGGRISRGHIVTITEKIDGSLGILYRDQGIYRVATRGSFDSDQSSWATLHLQKYDLSLLPNELTLLFEIVYPENRIVVDYKGAEKLVLLAARNRFTGEYLPYYPDLYELSIRFGFEITPTFTFNNITEIIERAGTMDLSAEGYVVEFSDGERFKFKGDRYLELHKLISGITFKHTLAAVASGNVGYIRSQIPDEFLGQFNKWVEEIESTAEDVRDKVEIYFNFSPRGSRKEFAQWVVAEHKDIANYLFAMLDGKSIMPMIYKLEFQNRREESALKQSESVA
jgi:RNA ligase